MDPSLFTVCVGMICKNVDSTIEAVLNNATRYGSCFNQAFYYIVDGHSTDLTQHLITQWCNKDINHRKWITQSTKDNIRPVKIVEARNLILEYFRPLFGDKTILLLMDTDTPNSGLFNLSSFVTCFDRDDWAGVFANQPTKYYDVWALRDEFCKEDWQKGWNPVLEPDTTHRLAKFEKPKPADLKFWPVKSAFGGAGMYRTHLIPSTAKYEFTSWDTEQQKLVEICEHVPFNCAISDKGGKLFINCEWMINDH